LSITSSDYHQLPVFFQTYFRITLYLPYPKNIRELSDLLPILWQQIPQEEIDNLIRRIREVIRVRGRNTDYLKLKQKLFYLI
jgi:hypothetical protein